MIRALGMAAVIVAVLLLAGFALGIYSWKRPKLGLVDGRLTDCPHPGNCVGSQATGNSAMPPLPFSTTPRDAWATLERVLGKFHRAKILSKTENYMHVEFTSTVFRFVDDVEFLLDAQSKQIHFRSASRVGRSDLGVNRKRMQQIREAFLEETS